MRIAILFVTLIIAITQTVNGQAPNELSLTELAVPNSPGFVLTDVSPTVVQNPNTPKSFVLAVAQSFGNNNGFPSNYAAEFTPYWWIRPEKRDVYSFLGFTHSDKDSTSINPFAGLKFLSVSVAFLSNDLIPDQERSDQKIFSIGLRSTIVKINRKESVAKLKRSIHDWHNAAQQDMEDLLLQLGPDLTEEQIEQKLAEFLKASESQKSAMFVKQVKDIVAEKPLFSWDVAGAYATYGIYDREWRTGRYGAWTSLSSYLPLNVRRNKGRRNASYLNFNLMLRYVVDRFGLEDNGLITRHNNFDFGGKIAYEVQGLSIGVESLNRYKRGEADRQNRTVGILTYRISDNIFLNGAFGKNFDHPNKLVAIFGVNWGIGKERITIDRNDRF